MSNIVVDYIIVSHSLRIFESESKNKVKAGWQPMGGISVAFDHKVNELVYTQAFVKYRP